MGQSSVAAFRPRDLVLWKLLATQISHAREVRRAKLHAIPELEFPRGLFHDQRKTQGIVKRGECRETLGAH